MIAIVIGSDGPSCCESFNLLFVFRSLLCASRQYILLDRC